jgi:outer membrane protein TolC
MWSLGEALAETIFDGGLRIAQMDQAVATYDVTVAQYRQTVLTALVEVEDNLAALRLLDEEGQVQDKALAAAREAERLALNQYKAGTANYLSVVVAQANSLTAARSAYQILGRRLSASVLLVKALGGRWETGDDAALTKSTESPLAQGPDASQ